MKKLFLILMCVSMHIASANAQSNSSCCEAEEGVILTNQSWKSNWFIGAGAGASLFTGTADKQGAFGDRLGLNYEFSVGKWLSPVVGLRVQYTGGEARGHISKSLANATAYGDSFVGKDGYEVYKQKWGYNYLHGDVMFNLSNVIGGYKDRLYSAVPYVGFGFIKSYTVEDNNEIVGHIGLNNVFSVSQAIDLNVDIKAIMMDQSFDTEIGNKLINGMVTASVGVAYKFKPRGFQKYSNKSLLAAKADLARANELLAQANKAKEDLQKQLDAEKSKAPKVIEKVSKELALGGCVIDFKIGESKLSKVARVNVGYIAKAIKEMPADKVFNLVGYADKQTGSSDRNNTLSKERAEAVYNALVNEFGVEKSKLNVVYKGGVDNMFYDEPALSRVVIVE